MARTTISETDMSAADSGAVVSFDTGDSANDMDYRQDGSVGLLIHNDTGGSATVTIVSTADSLGRTKDISLSMTDGDIAYIPPKQMRGWVQDDGQVHVDMNANVSIEAIRQ